MKSLNFGVLLVLSEIGHPLVPKLTGKISDMPKLNYREIAQVVFALYDARKAFLAFQGGDYDDRTFQFIAGCSVSAMERQLEEVMSREFSPSTSDEIQFESFNVGHTWLFEELKHPFAESNEESTVMHFAQAFFIFRNAEGAYKALKAGRKAFDLAVFDAFSEMSLSTLPDLVDKMRQVMTNDGEKSGRVQSCAASQI